MIQVSTSLVGEPVTARGRATRKALLEAAEEVFGVSRFDRASIAEITRRAGVAQGTFYVYFRDKQAIFEELVRELNRSVRHHIASAIDGLTGRMDIERAGFEAYFGFIVDHGSIYKIVREAEFVAEDVYRWHYRRLAEGYIKGLSQAVDSGQIIALDPEPIAYLLMGIAEFTGSRYVIWEGRTPSQETFEEIISFIQRGLAPTGKETM